MRRLLLLITLNICGCHNEVAQQSSNEVVQLRDDAGHPHGVTVFRIDAKSDGSLLWDGRRVTEAELVDLLSPEEPMIPEPAIDLHYDPGVAADREEAITRLVSRSPFTSVAVFREGKLIRPASH